MKWWSIIKQNRPPASEVHNILNDDVQLFIHHTDHTGKEYTKDNVGWSKWKQLIEISGDKENKLPNQEFLFVVEHNGELIPEFWDSNTGWDIEELDNEMMGMMGLLNESGYKEYSGPPPPPPPKG